MATRAKTKAGVLPANCNIDQCCHHSNQLIHISLVKAKDHGVKELKPKTQKPKTLGADNFSPFQQGKISERARKKKKKRWQRGKSEKKEANFNTSTTGVNMTNTNKSQKKNASRVVCYNCNKKGHYFRNCTKPKKDNASKN